MIYVFTVAYRKNNNEILFNIKNNAIITNTETKIAKRFIAQTLGERKRIAGTNEKIKFLNNSLLD